MTSGVSWEVEDLPQQTREAAREAARRSGMSVGEWLDSVISDNARSDPRLSPAADDDDTAGIKERTLGRRHTHADYDGHQRRAPTADIAEVKGRLDEVGRQLDQLSRLNANQAYLRPNLRLDEPPRELADVLWKLDRRLDQLIGSGRPADAAVEPRAAAAPREVAAPDREPAAAAADPSTPLEQALMEIAERQRALDAGGGPAASPSSRADVLPRAPTQDLSNLEEQLRQVTTRIETLRPCGVNAAVETLREDLAEIGLMLKEAMPRQSIEALEAEVRALSERLHLNGQSAGTDAAIAGVERGLAEIRDALRGLTPAENLVGVDETVRELSRKIDLIAFNSQDPAAMEQLEGAIVGLRGIATQVASDGVLAKLSDEVRTLAAKIDQIASSAGLLATLEQRISSMAEVLETRQAGAPAPGDLDAIVKGLADRLERIGFTRSDQAAVGQLEDRITHLVEKLDSSNARLDHLETIEHALADLLVFLERQPEIERSAAPPSPEVTSLRQDVIETQSSLQNVQGALDHLIDRLATIESDIRSASPPPAPDKPPAAAALPTVAAVAPAQPAAPAPAVSPAAAAGRAAERNPAPPVQHEHRPIDPSLPPDHPLEPGAVRSRPGNSPVDRIAASEAALGAAKPPAAPEPGGKSNFIAAARRAAQAANSESAVRGDKPAPTPAAGKVPAGKAAGGWGARVRSVLVAVSVVLIVLSSLHLVASLFGSSDDSEDGSRPQETQTIPKRDDPTIAPEAPNRTTVPDGPTAPGPNMPAATAPGRQSLTVPADGQIPAAAPGVAAPASIPGGAAAGVEKKDITGSISRPVAGLPAAPVASASVPAPAGPPRLASAPNLDKLPAAIAGQLRAAAAKGDAAAEYEIAQRYAEGRGLPQNLAEAADWFDRAAKQGLAPALFRLGGFYEKGFGVKKDLDTARRLYSAAAEAGNAKAMHNLAVLYAEGIDGKPDYQNAAKWFRKAADYGLADSQYNLGILYGRGIGMEPKPAEAYKWFALAARDGDRESAAKRDEMGSRLDSQALAAAKLAVQSFAPLEQPEAAMQPAVPPGGWDGVAAPPSGTSKARNPGPKSDRAAPAARSLNTAG